MSARCDSDEERWGGKFPSVSQSFDKDTVIEVQAGDSLHSEKMREYRGVKQHGKKVPDDQICLSHNKQRERYTPGIFDIFDIFEGNKTISNLNRHTSNCQKISKWVNASNCGSDRSSNLCREMNLKKGPNLGVWSTPEDALLKNIYNLFGSNAIKNRFNHIRRQLKTDLEKYSGYYKKSIHTDGQQQHCEQNLYFSSKSREHSAKIVDMLEHFATESLRGSNITKCRDFVFGPMRAADPSGEICRRCGLFAPSIQTGRTICTRTDWCYACTKIPVYVNDTMLRNCLQMRNSICSRNGLAKYISV